MTTNTNTLDTYKALDVLGITAINMDDPVDGRPVACIDMRDARVLLETIDSLHTENEKAREGKCKHSVTAYRRLVAERDALQAKIDAVQARLDHEEDGWNVDLDDIRAALTGPSA